MKQNKNNKSEKGNVYQMVTDKVIEQMQKGIIPWHRPWTGTGETINYVSRKPYSLLNQILLGREGEWLSFKQVKDLGGTIKKGAKAGMVVFYTKYTVSTGTKKNEDGEDEEIKVTEFRDIPVLRYYNVFHIDDCIGIESKIKENQPTETINPDERAEGIINAYVEREDTLKFHNDKP